MHELYNLISESFSPLCMCIVRRCIRQVMSTLGRAFFFALTINRCVKTYVKKKTVWPNCKRREAKWQTNNNNDIVFPTISRNSEVFQWTDRTKSWKASWVDPSADDLLQTCTVHFSGLYRGECFESQSRPEIQNFRLFSMEQKSNFFDVFVMFWYRIALECENVFLPLTRE